MNEIDFTELWKVDYSLRPEPSDAQEWNERARTAPEKFGPGGYADAFLELAALREGESIFDMGCGPGSLAIPCARMGHRVLAADFSSRMLELLAENLPPEFASRVETKLLAWEDDWLTAGVEPKSCDVAFASRSIATADLGAALAKLCAVARRRVCTTVVSSASPRVSQALVRGLQIPQKPRNDAAFVYAIALQLGYEPEASYVRSKRYDCFATPRDAIAAYTKMLGFCEGVDEQQRASLEPAVRVWVEDSLVSQDELLAREPNASYSSKAPLGPGAVCVSEPRVSTWAFIAWNLA